MRETNVRKTNERAPGSDRNRSGGGSRRASPSTPTSISGSVESTENSGVVHDR